VQQPAAEQRQENRTDVDEHCGGASVDVTFAPVESDHLQPEPEQPRPPRRDLRLNAFREACRVARRRRTAAAGGSGPPVRSSAADQITTVLPGQGSDVVRVQGHCLARRLRPHGAKLGNRTFPPAYSAPRRHSRRARAGSPLLLEAAHRYTRGALV
jgi:hypothetical protein